MKAQEPPYHIGTAALDNRAERIRTSDLLNPIHSPTLLQVIKEPTVIIATAMGYGNGRRDMAVAKRCLIRPVSNQSDPDKVAE